MRENQNLICGHSFDTFFRHFVVLYRICRFDIVDEVFRFRHSLRSDFFMRFNRFNMIFECNSIISGTFVKLYIIYSCFGKRQEALVNGRGFGGSDLNCMKLSSSFFDKQQRLYLYRMKKNFICSTIFLFCGPNFQFYRGSL